MNGLGREINMNFLKSALFNGLLLGLIIVFFQLSSYIISIDTFLNWWLQLSLTFVASVFFMVKACIQYRKEMNGSLSFLMALKTTFVTFVVGMGINIFFSFVLYNYIDVKLSEKVKNRTINFTEKMMTKFGAPQKDIQNAISEVAEIDYRPTILKSLKQLLNSFLYGLLLSIIISGIIKHSLERSKS